MLTLIGLGLFDEKDLTLRGLEEAKNSDKVFIELYTGKWYGSLQILEKLVGKKIRELSRKDLEENSKEILEQVKKQNVTIFVQGDPLVATTHSALLLEAKKLGVKTKVIHNASIISAIGETGLHLYKFGPTVTIPFPEKTKGKIPESVYEIISDNKSRGLHTLCLLDVVAEEKKFMNVEEGIEILLELENKIGRKVFTKNSEVVVFSKVGSNNSKIAYGKASEVIKQKFEIPSIIIVVGKLHFTEREYLENI